MPLIKHVDGKDVPMTAGEEAEFLATLPVVPAPPEPSKAELLAQVQALLAKVEAMEG